ncbi:MAG: hypothetical protein NTX24_02745 [Candidatus Pacearchaeota archaeon]|nr:hypothetical protein [Candidatus Pacearchaeota archaeon]
MNKTQWIVLGIGLLILFGYLSFMAPQGISSDHVQIGNIDLMLMMMYQREYAYTILASISGALGILFIICGFLEPKKKI